MKFNRVLVLASALTMMTGLAHAGETITLTDITGHEVTVEVPVKHMILGEGRFLPSLGILDPENPVRWVAGMMGEFKSLDPSTFAKTIWPRSQTGWSASPTNQRSSWKAGLACRTIVARQWAMP